ncbi:glycosyltransferase [bacterium]|nr:glycosyltransferase [bacterium]
MTPLLTVGLPIYNAEAYLTECLQSIKTQTLKEFEVIAILDCPTDKSAEILRQHADSRFRILENERNLGTARTINRIIELSSTELLARMDSDDVMFPERLQRQFDYLNEHPEIAAVGSYFNKIDERSREIESPFVFPVTPDEIRERFREYVCFQHGAATFRLAPLRAVGGFDHTLAEDLYVTLKLLAGGYQLANIPEPLLSYRIHSQSITFAAEEATLRAADEAYRIYGPKIWGERAPDYVGGRTRLQRLRRRMKRNLSRMFTK